MELGWSYPKRKKLLDELYSQITGKTQNEFFQNGYKDFQKHSVPIGLPKYRIDNGRTYAAQAKYIANSKLPEDFFEKDPESEHVQQIQHEILKAMGKEKNLVDFFKTNKQSEAVILSHDGFVINGNRRLSCWRELYEGDKSRFAHFSHIDVIILPSASQKDIDEMEAKLQVHKDIKADYTWIATALLLKHRQSSYNYSPEALSELFDLTVSEIKELFDMLFYAEAYLEDRDRIGQYDLVERTEYAFRQLHKRRSKIKGEPYKEVFEKLSFCLIDKAEEGRLYESIPAVADHLDKIIEKIETDFQVNPSSSASEEIELLGGGNMNSLAGVLDLLDDESNYDKLRELTLDIIDSEAAKNKEKAKMDFVLLQVKKANTALLEACGAITEMTSKEGIESQIREIEESLVKVKQWLINEA